MTGKLQISTNVSVIDMTAAQFIQTLWPNYQGDGYFNIWTAPKKITYNFELAKGIDNVDATVQSLVHEDQHVYFQVGLQASNTGPKSRGKELTTIAIPGFWHDTDISVSWSHLFGQVCGEVKL